MCLSTHTENELANVGLTPGRNSRRQRHPRALDDEELFIIEGSPAATGAQLQDNPEEREKCAKCAKNPSLPHLVEELKLWHLPASPGTPGRPA